VLEEPALSARRKALATLPKKLDDAFAITIIRIQKQPEARARQAMEVLKWTLLAKKQLSVTQLRHALSVTPGDTKLDYESFPSERSLTTWCLGLVILDKETSSIRLTHKSLFEYLVHQQKIGKLFENGHSDIAYTCLRYMSFTDDSLQWENTLDTDQFEALVTQHLDKFCLLWYSIENWGQHSAEDGTNNEAIKEEELRFFLRPSNTHCISRGLQHLSIIPAMSAYVIQINTRKELKLGQEFDMSFGLHASAFFGRTSILKALLETENTRST
jgi:hypothetical protein